jgi:hypothetical protein
MTSILGFLRLAVLAFIGGAGCGGAIILGLLIWVGYVEAGGAGGPPLWADGPMIHKRGAAR